MKLSRSMNRRHSPNRRQAWVDVMIDVNGTTHPATICDVSYDGMKLSVPVRIEPGSPIKIAVMGQSVPAIVHWHCERHIGVHLLGRLEADVLFAIENSLDGLSSAHAAE